MEGYPIWDTAQLMDKSAKKAALKIEDSSFECNFAFNPKMDSVKNAKRSDNAQPPKLGAAKTVENNRFQAG